MQIDGMPNDKARYLITSIVLFRVVLAPIFSYLYIKGLIYLSLLTVLLVIFLDYLDGILVKRYRVVPIFGPYLDPVSDFVFVLVGFSSLVALRIYPLWLVFLIIFMFFQFIMSSGLKKPVYDPIGKYYGIALIVILGISVFQLGIHTLLLFIVVLLTIVSLIYRHGVYLRK